jgi:hypothetical protein
MSWSINEKKWAQEILRGYYGGMMGVAVSGEDIDTLLFGDVEADRIAVATAYAQNIIRPRLQGSLSALDDQATVIEAEISEIPAS